MNKILGIFGLLVFVCVFTTVLNDGFVSAYNMYNITRWSALFGILSIGVAFVIITGGIDLSIGSVVGLIGCLLPLFLTRYGWSVPVSLAAVLLIAAAIGLLHGLLITRLELQPFVVTLCGLLFYRGFARWWTEDQTQGFGQQYDDGLRLLATGKPCSVATLLLVCGVALSGYFLLRLLRTAAGPAGRGLPALVGLILALLVTAVGASRFRYGYEATAGQTLGTIGPYAIKALQVEVPPAGVLLPAAVMRTAGLSLFVPSVLACVLLGVLARPVRVALPAVVLLAAGVTFWLCQWHICDEFQSIVGHDQYRFGALPMSGHWLRALIMLLTFLAVGFLLGAAGWLIAAVRGTSQVASDLLPLALGSGVIWLMGQTELAQTMVPMPLLIMIGLAVLAGIFLNQTIYGRYLLALGRNEEAARYSGINTGRMVVLAYVICSVAAGLGAVLFAADLNSVQPSGHGNFYELYAIAAAVLGGCSLRGGEGSITGVVIGAAVMRVLYNAINILGIPTQLEFAIIGLVILTGAVVDVLVKRVVARRRAILQARQAEEPSP
jgi:ribose/xylose/arabinose/galactoside ABC-type transport system permease subunit